MSRTAIVIDASFPRVVVRVIGTVSTSTTELCFEVEAHTNTSVKQQIQIKNQDSGQFETLDYRFVESDTLLHVSIPGDPDKYIGSSGQVEGRLRYFIVAPVFDTNWAASINLAQFRYMQ
ncbi:MAG: hypothetical protein WAO58_03690 [Fimbriimonadaceae bacterium]